MPKKNSNNQTRRKSHIGYTNIYKVQMEFVLSKVGGFPQNPPKLRLSFLFG